MRFSTFTILSVVAGGLAAQALSHNVRAELDDAVEQVYRRAVANLVIEELAQRDYDVFEDLYRRGYGANSRSSSSSKSSSSSSKSNSNSNSGSRKRSGSTNDANPPSYSTGGGPAERRKSAPGALASDPAPEYSSRRGSAASSTGSSAAGHVADGFRRYGSRDYLADIVEELYRRGYSNNSKSSSSSSSKSGSRKRSGSTNDANPPSYSTGGGPAERRKSAPGALASDPAPEYSSRRGSTASTGSSAAGYVADGFRPSGGRT